LVSGSVVTHQAARHVLLLIGLLSALLAVWFGLLVSA
jgi:hypothetical protein